MTLRRKTLIVISLTLAVLVGVIYFSSRLTLMRGYANFEIQEAEEDVDRVRRAFGVQLQSFASPLIGYSAWDESYRFATDPGGNAIDSSLMNLTFVNNGLSVVVIVNTDLEIIYGKSFDYATGKEGPLPEGLAAYLQAGSPLLAANGVNGILTLPEGTMMVAAQPILKSDASGPPAGTMIWGRLLTAEAFQSLGMTTDFRITSSVYRVDELPAGFRVAKTVGGSAPQVLVSVLDDTTLAGYTVINDIYDNPALLLQINLRRDIYSRGLDSVNYFMVALVLSAGVFLLVIGVFFERAVLMRLDRINATLARVRYTGNLETPVDVGGGDEFANVAMGLRDMLAALAETQDALHETNGLLEKRVAQRTIELSEANNLLRVEIGERKQTQADLALARDQALEALQLKTQILANLSHDARTPLTTIMLRTELLQRGRYGQMTPEQQQVFDIILRNARELLGFVNNLLTEAQASGEKIVIERVEFDPAALLAEACNTFAPHAERKKLAIAWHLGENVPSKLVGDPYRLLQILNNLIDNAIKFSETGTINVSIDLPDEHHWALHVRDTGKGIPRDAHEKIFESFWQIDGSITREATRGVGLGLSIVRQLTLFMDGKISVDSETGQGARFTVTLPRLTLQGVQ